jgi:hypothetical protein
MDYRGAPKLRVNLSLVQLFLIEKMPSLFERTGLLRSRRIRHENPLGGPGSIIIQETVTTLLMTPN